MTASQIAGGEVLSRPELTVARQRIAILVVSMGGLVAAFMQTLVFPIVGYLPVYLDTSVENASWVVTATLISATIAMPVSGRLADMFGKRRVILGCVAFMVVGSVICALTSELVPVIVGRGLQGVAMGVIPCGISLMRDLIDSSRVPGAVAVVSATMGIGGAIGLPVSAWVAEVADWHMLFWSAGALSAALYLALRFFVRESPMRASGPFDRLGGLTLCAALICLLVPVSKGGQWGWFAPMTLGLALVGVAFFATWVFVELRHPAPLVDLRTSVKPIILLTNCASCLLGFAMMASAVSLPQLLQLPRVPGVVDGMNLGLVTAGLVLAPTGLIMVVVAPVSGRLISRWGPRVSLVAGGSLMTVGYASLILPPENIWHVVASQCVAGAGTALCYAAMPSLVMSAAPPEQSASANSVNALCRSAGTAVGSAAVASILAFTTSSLSDSSAGSVPPTSAFQLVLGVSAAASLAATTAALGIPYRHGTAVEVNRPASGGDRLRPSDADRDGRNQTSRK
ncbi:MFS transporter [Gordonia sp. NPDC127522]|uniref:MFS transporter n=1 Tax=Gordonia sp. NPDC127522 TaxID=3345390 RepID=UPI003628D560